MVADAPNLVGKRVSKINLQFLCGFESHPEYKIGSAQLTEVSRLENGEVLIACKG